MPRVVQCRKGEPASRSTSVAGTGMQSSDFELPQRAELSIADDQWAMLLEELFETNGHGRTDGESVACIVRDDRKGLGRFLVNGLRDAQAEKKVPVLPGRQVDIEWVVDDEPAVEDVAGDVDPSPVTEEVLGTIQSNRRLDHPTVRNEAPDDPAGDRRPRSVARQDVIRMEEADELRFGCLGSGLLGCGHPSRRVGSEVRNPQR